MNTVEQPSRPTDTENRSHAKEVLSAIHSSVESTLKGTSLTDEQQKEVLEKLQQDWNLRTETAVVVEPSTSVTAAEKVSPASNTSSSEQKPATQSSQGEDFNPFLATLPEQAPKSAPIEPPNPFLDSQPEVKQPQAPEPPNPFLDSKTSEDPSAVSTNENERQILERTVQLDGQSYSLAVVPNNSDSNWYMITIGLPGNQMKEMSLFYLGDRTKPEDVSDEVKNRGHELAWSNAEKGKRFKAEIIDNEEMLLKLVRELIRTDVNDFRTTTSSDWRSEINTTGPISIGESGVQIQIQSPSNGTMAWDQARTKLREWRQQQKAEAEGQTATSNTAL